MYAVGRDGKVLHFNGTEWYSEPRITFSNLNTLWGSSADDLYVMGNYGAILHDDGTAQPTPIPTSNAEPWYCTRLEMPAEFFSPGDTCYLKLEVENSRSIHSANIFVILDVKGEYWFYPSWESNQDSSYVSNLSAGLHTFDIIPEFIWPDTGNTGMNGVKFWAAITDRHKQEILGGSDGISTWTFGF